MEDRPPRGSGGPLSTFLSIDGGHVRMYSSDISQGGRRQRFLALMVGAPGCIALEPLRGVPSMFLSVDGGRSWISVSTHQGPIVDVS
jgi:hypothetical protein